MLTLDKTAILIWGCVARLVDKNILENDLITAMLKFPETTFTSEDIDVQIHTMYSWRWFACALFSITKEDTPISIKLKRAKLLVLPVIHKYGPYFFINIRLKYNTNNNLLDKSLVMWKFIISNVYSADFFKLYDLLVLPVVTLAKDTNLKCINSICDFLSQTITPQFPYETECIYSNLI